MAAPLPPLARTLTSRCSQFLPRSGLQSPASAKNTHHLIRNGSLARKSSSHSPKINDREQEAFIKVFQKIIQAEQSNPKSLTADRLEKSQAVIQKFPETLKPLVTELEQTVLVGRLANGNDMDVETKLAEADEMDSEARERLEIGQRLSKEAYERIVDDIGRCGTDMEVVELLERELFTLARNVDKEELETRTAKDNAEEILSANYSSLLVFALRHLKSHFPGSCAPLVVYSRMKAAGSKSHALAASTQLYNLFIEANWTYYGDAQQSLDLLEEMDRQGLDFDQKTAVLVKSITKSVKTDSKLLGQMKSKDQAHVGELEGWRERIMHRMQDAASRKALELAQLQNRRASALEVS
jgi:hypothetical protein